MLETKNTNCMNYVIKSVFLALLVSVIAYFPLLALAKNEVIRISLAGSGPPTKLFTKERPLIPCAEISEYTKNKSTRGFLDLIIMCESFRLAKLDVTIHMVKTNNYHRSLRIAKNGFSDMSAETIWLEDIDKESFYYTAAVLDIGEYQKGIYTLEGSPIQNQPIEQLDLSAYNGITVKNWKLDWQVINELTNNVTEANSLSNVYQMLKAKRADFTLIAFGGKEYEIKTLNDITLIPLQGAKVVFNNSRHFVVSKKTPHALKIINALNQGVERLRETGELKAIYKSASFFNEYTRNWRVLNPSGQVIVKTEILSNE